MKDEILCNDRILRNGALAIFAIAIVLAMLMPFVFAQNPGAGIPNLGDENFLSAPDYQSLSNMTILCIAAVIFIASLVHMISKSVKNAEWETYANSELYQVTISILIGILIFSSAVVVDKIVTDHWGASSFDLANNYLQKVTCITSATTIKLEGVKIGVQYLAGMKSRFYAAAAGWGFSFPTFPGFDVIDRAIDLIVMFITPFAASIMVQQMGLQLIHASAMTLILPAGIIMRVFSPTRDAGSFLMATAFALYFVMPFAFVMNAQIMTQLYVEEYGCDMCSGMESSTTDYLFTSGSFYNSLSVQMLPSIKEDFIGNDGMTKTLSYIAFQAVFLPAMNMILVVTFIKAGMKFFSQKWD
ncbi:MAG: hypothetical protein WC492_02190 [Candidatus Micrarchaeia archaeon]